MNETFSGFFLSGPPANITMNHTIAARYATNCLLVLAHKYILHVFFFILKLNEVDISEFITEFTCSFLTPKIFNVVGMLYLLSFFTIKTLSVYDPVLYLSLNHDVGLIIVDAIVIVINLIIFFSKLAYSSNICYPRFAESLLSFINIKMELKIESDIFEYILIMFNNISVILIIILVIIITVIKYKNKLKKSRIKSALIAKNSVVPSMNTFHSTPEEEKPDDKINIFYIEVQPGTSNHQTVHQVSNLKAIERTTDNIESHIQSIEKLVDYAEVWQNAKDSLISISHLCTWFLTLIYCLAFYSHKGNYKNIFLFSIVKWAESLPLVLIIYNVRLRSYVIRKIVVHVHHFFPKFKYLIIGKTDS